MRKCDELKMKNSCWNKAADNEMLFTLLGRDEAAPAAIRAWVGERLRLGKNNRMDEQIQEALLCAHIMENELALAKVTKQSA